MKEFSEPKADLLAHVVTEVYDSLATKADLHEITVVVRELADAQGRTELRVEELAAAQKQTARHMGELSAAQKQTERRMGAMSESRRHADIQCGEISRDNV